MQVYEQGKLRKFMTLINHEMNDALLFLSQKTFRKYYEFFSYFIPESIVMKATNDINTRFKNGYTYSSQDEDSFYKFNSVKPLFYLEILKNSESQTFYYSTEPADIQATIEMLFDKLLDDLNKIPCVEKTLLHDLFRKAGQLRDVFVKAPQREKDEEVLLYREQQSSSEWDENKWITDIFQHLSKEIKQSLQPLFEYIKYYDQYKQILAINPEELIKTEYQNEENPKDVDSIKEEIKQYYEKERKVRAEMKDEMQISYFLIDCKETIR